MRLTVLLVAAVTFALTVVVPASADPAPATALAVCTQPDAPLPPGPPEKKGSIIVTPSPKSGKGPTVMKSVPGPCSAPGFFPNR